MSLLENPLAVWTIKRSNPNEEIKHSSAQKWLESLKRDYLFNEQKKPNDRFKMLENNSGKKLSYISRPAHMNDASKEVTNQ